MNLKHENIHEYVIKCTNTTQITLDDDFNVMDSKPDIDLIVKEWGMAVVNGVRVNQDKAQIDGTLVFAIMYTGSSENDKRFIPVRMDGSLNFLENVNLSCDATGLDVNCKAQLEDLTIKSINSRKISVKAIVALTVTCEEIKNISISTGIEDGDCNAELLLKDFEYVQADVNMKDNLRIKETVSVPNGKADIGSLVWDDVDVRNVNTRMTEDGLSVSGELNVFIMYIADDEAGQVQWYETSTPFTGIIDVSGANPDGISYVGYNVISKNVAVLFVWLYAAAYVLHLYFDFSGYSDMAIGLGRIFGFHFIENFNYPYISASVTEFWRRWHMSLGSWFRDYVYIPLGGNRVSKAKWFRNIFIVWLLTGLWHGAAWTFILWGLFFAVFLTAEKLWYGEALAQTRFLKHLYVLLLIAVSFVIFDAASVSDAFRTIGSLFGLGGLPRSDVLARYYFDSYSGVFLVAIVGATPLPAKIVRQFSEDDPGKKIMSVVEPVVLLGLLTVVTAYLVDGSFNPFLYFRF